MPILNESPTRQGGPFTDFGKTFLAVKNEHATYLDRSDFIGAYFNNKLIGYIKLVYADKFMRTMQVLSMIKYRDKAATNALMAEAVRICAGRGIPFLVYGKYDYGRVGSPSLTEFKSHSGFEYILLPRYFVPLTLIGRIAFRCQLHKGISGILPKAIVRLILTARKKWYSN